MFLNSDVILQRLSEAILITDKDGYIRYANPHASCITGYAADELVNKHLYIFYGDKEERIKAEYELGMAQKKGKFVSEGWRLKKDGSQFWGEMILAPVQNESGSQSGFSCILRDNTERKKEELALRQNEERYRLMVEGVKDYAIFMLDPGGHIITWNEGAKRTKGYFP